MTEPRVTQPEALREALEQILALGLNIDSKPMHTIANDAYEAHCIARAALEAQGAGHQAQAVASSPEAAAVAALRELDERLRSCAEQCLSASEAYDSFYQEVVADALAETQRSSHTAGSDENESGVGAEPPALPNNDEVICPACCHQFRAIPVNVQRLMLDAGFEPPFDAARAAPPALTDDK